MPAYQPLDRNGYVRAFLDRVRPDICLWTGGDLYRPLLTQAARQGVDLILADIDEKSFDSVRRGLFRHPVTYTLDLFDPIFITSADVKTQLERLGAPTERVSILPALRPEILPEPCNETDLRDVTGTLAGRRLWLAAHVAIEEIEDVIAAHRHAVRRVPRLLLVVVPDNQQDAPIFRERLAASGLQWSDFDDDGPPEDLVQVVLSDDPRNLALWYRVAALCFLGSSLWPGLGGRDPLQAAALGAAILCGPNVKQHLWIYEDLSKAGAARIVRDGRRLGQAVLDLITPDRSAAMALAGWDFATKGAAVTDRLLDLIQDRLEDRLQSARGDPDASA